MSTQRGQRSFAANPMHEFLAFSRSEQILLNEKTWRFGAVPHISDTWCNLKAPGQLVRDWTQGPGQ